MGRGGGVSVGRRWPYLGDSDNGEDVSFAEGQVLLGGTVEVVLGDTFCTGRPNGLAGERGGDSVRAQMSPDTPLSHRNTPPPPPPDRAAGLPFLCCKPKRDPLKPEAFWGILGSPGSSAGAFQLRWGQGGTWGSLILDPGAILEGDGEVGDPAPSLPGTYLHP